MATIPTYISESDLRDVYPQIDKFDTKSPVYGWVVHSGALYRADNCGLINQLFADGKDLGAAEANSGVVNVNDEWYYESTLDAVYYYNSVTSPADMLMEAGEDWATHKSDIMSKSSRFFDSLIDRTQPRSQWKDVEGNFDYVIIRTVALFAAYFLISAHDPENPIAEAFKTEADDYVERINTGLIKLGFQVTQDSSQGTLREVLVNDATQLRPVDMYGLWTGSYDKIKLKVTLGGAISAAKYSVWVAGNDKLGIDEGSQVVTDQIITGQYQTLAGGLQIRFGQKDKSDVATTNDEYEIEVFSHGQDVQDSGGVRAIDVYHS